MGHSGGGLLPLMYLARYPEYQPGFSGLVTLGAQATGAAETRAHKFRALALYVVTQVLGRTPRVRAAMGDEGEPTALLAQWALWNLKGQWKGRDGMDYMARLGGIHIPGLVIAGSRDEIAPVKGCETVCNRLGSPDKTWVECGLASGFSRDYSHGGLSRGTAAAREIFPMVSAWIRERSGI